MLHKIGIEETFAIPETLGCSQKYFPKDVWPKFSAQILDFMKYRIEDMDRYGMDLAVLSLNSPAIQAIYNKEEAIEVAKRANDTMADAMEKLPNRFRGFAALPMQDPDAAIKEMHRAVKDLGCLGVLVNGYSQIDTEDKYKYLDDPMYSEFWAEVEKLDVPFYLHPREPMDCNNGQVDGHPWLYGAAWTFGVETATHALRLMSSGLFDKHPRLKLILGHMGETLPFCIWRTSNRIKREQRGIPAKRPLIEYMQENVWITTSGQHRDTALWNTIMEFGSDKIMFATDFPFESIQEACEWFDACSISDNDKKKIGRDNIIKLLDLKF